MRFEPLYFAERLTVVNPEGDVGVITCWAPVKTALDVMRRAGVDLSQTSRIAVVANLYGGGLSEMVRNLLYNPQIAHLLIFGPDLSGAGLELFRLLGLGVRPVRARGQDRFRILETGRSIAGGFDPASLVGSISVTRLEGKLSAPEVMFDIRRFFADLPAEDSPRRHRVKALLPEYKPGHFPSNPLGHQVVGRHPLDVWEEIVHRLDRYGVPVALEKGKRRRELLNLKAVITEPVEEVREHLLARGFDPLSFAAYQKQVLDPASPPPGVEYTYGYRLRGHFWDALDGVFDGIERMSSILRADPESRSAYLTLWDNGVDTSSDTSHPCMVGLFFRVSDGLLTLTATYRVHNAMDAWLKNVYGLMAIQRAVADGAGLPPGPLCVLSHSISINLDYQDGLDRVGPVVADRTTDEFLLDRATGKQSDLNEDPCGAFVISIDDRAGTVIADLVRDGDLLVRYTGRTAYEVERQIARDRTITLISHALYVGRELAKAEARLNKLAIDCTP